MRKDAKTDARIDMQAAGVAGELGEGTINPKGLDQLLNTASQRHGDDGIEKAVGKIFENVSVLTGQARATAEDMLATFSDPGGLADSLKTHNNQNVDKAVVISDNLAAFGSEYSAEDAASDKANFANTIDTVGAAIATQSAELATTKVAQTAGRLAELDNPLRAIADGTAHPETTTQLHDLTAKVFFNENVDFLADARAFKDAAPNMTAPQKEAKFQELVSTYILDGSASQVNVDNAIRTAVEDIANGTAPMTDQSLDAAMDAVVGFAWADSRISGFKDTEAGQLYIATGSYE